MAESFHPDFYVTCATAIPVLFLAVRLQAQDFESTLARLTKPRVQQVLLSIAYASVLAGGAGEVVSLVALLLKQDVFGWKVFVLVATLLLLAVVLYSPFWGFLRAVSGKFREAQGTFGGGGNQAGAGPGAGRPG
jgi:hypothetical protein